MEAVMTAPDWTYQDQRAKARFGGAFRRLSGLSRPLMIGLAGRRWNPVFSVVEHVGRRTGRRFATPVAARRVADGFVISLAFGAHADWHRNLIAGGGTIRWRGHGYLVETPVRIHPDVGQAAFDPVQRLFMRLARIDGYVFVPDVPARGDGAING
jgi:deazaflavin-dependent oxidoreductase (nitroreductase family)